MNRIVSRSAVPTDGHDDTPGPPAKKENAQRRKETRGAIRNHGSVFGCTAGNHGTAQRMLRHLYPRLSVCLCGLYHVRTRCQQECSQKTICRKFTGTHVFQQGDHRGKLKHSHAVILITVMGVFPAVIHFSAVNGPCDRAEFPCLPALTVQLLPGLLAQLVLRDESGHGHHLFPAWRNGIVSRAGRHGKGRILFDGADCVWYDSPE